MDNLLGNSQLIAGITPVLNALLALPNPTPQQILDIADLQDILFQLQQTP